MSGFTPGPWVVGPVDDTVVTHLGADGQRYEVAAIDGDYNDPDLWPIMEANARLIAAAPDGLEANREAADFLRSYFGPVTSDDPDGWSDQDARAVYERLCAAIAKADGHS